LTAKLSAIAFCYRDGGEKESDLLPEQKERMVTKLPSVLEMLSYVYFCSACICGPFFEYADYIQYIEMKGRYAKIPSNFKQAGIKFLKGKLCLAFHIGVSIHCYALFCGTEEYA